jgi:hypothetical protein
MDPIELTHSGCASGLCNAVALSKEDQKLPRLKWTDCDKRECGRPLDTCRRRVVFAESDSMLTVSASSAQYLKVQMSSLLRTLANRGLKGTL